MILSVSVATVIIDNYNLISRPTIDPLTGNDTINSCVDSTPVICSTSATLTDAMLGPLKSDGSGGKVHAWNRATSSRIRIECFVPAMTTLTQVRLFFYNIPILHIGLPDVEIYAGDGTLLEYYLLGNENLTQDDNMRGDVLLSLLQLTPPPSNNLYRVEFVFGNTDVDSLRLSEIIMCDQPNGNVLFI